MGIPFVLVLCGRLKTRKFDDEEEPHNFQKQLTITMAQIEMAPQEEKMGEMEELKRRKNDRELKLQKVKEQEERERMEKAEKIRKKEELKAKRLKEIKDEEMK